MVRASFCWVKEHLPELRIDDMMLSFLRRWPSLLAVVVLLGLFLYMTGLGFGGTSDSQKYLWAAKTWRESRRLMAPDGRPYRYWGPLYPLLLAAFYRPAAVRLLHGAALVIQLILWGRIGKWLLPAGRAAFLPWLVALSAAILVPAAFIWSETVFGAIAVAYIFPLLEWCRRGKASWLVIATAAGFLLPLQRTSGFFLLAGVGAGILFTGLWRGHWRQLLAHWVGCAAGGLVWNYYAEVVAGPPAYQNIYAWDELGSLADYGFVLARWFVPLAASWRDAAPVLWAVVLGALLYGLFPVNRRLEGGTQFAFRSQLAITAQSLQLLWWVVLLTVVALLFATYALRAATGTHNAERYCAVLVGPVVLLALARWPARPPLAGRWAGRWLGPVLLGGWLAYSAVRVGHNVQQQRKRPLMQWPDWNLRAPLADKGASGGSGCRHHTGKYASRSFQRLSGASSQCHEMAVISKSRGARTTTVGTELRQKARIAAPCGWVRGNR